MTTKRFYKITKNQLLTSHEFYSFLNKTKIKHIGKLPTQFSKAGFPKNQTFSIFDNLAKTLRKLGCPDVSSLNFSFRKISFKLYTVHKKDDAFFGVVYRLCFNNFNFAFKIFWNTDIIPRLKEEKYNGRYGETASGLYFNNRSSNCAFLYCGNPRLGWIISEWVGPNTDMRHRAGVPIQALLFSKKLMLSSRPNNLINGIVVDRGDILPIQKQVNLTLKQFQNKLLKAGPIESSKFIQYLPTALQQKTLISLLRSYPNDRLEIGKQFRHLHESIKVHTLKRITKIFFDDHKLLEVLFQRIWSLPKKDKSRIFNSIIKNFGFARTIVVQQIRSIPIRSRTHFFKDVMTHYPEISKTTVRYVWFLPESQYNSVLVSLKPHKTYHKLVKTLRNKKSLIDFLSQNCFLRVSVL